MALMTPGVYIKEVDLSLRFPAFNPMLKRIRERKFNIWNWWEKKRKISELLIMNLEDKDYLDFVDIWHQPIKPLERIDLRFMINKGGEDIKFVSNDE